MAERSHAHQAAEALARQAARALVVLAAAFALAGCATYSDRLRAAHEAAGAGDWAAAEQRLNRLLDVESSEDLPETWDEHATLAALERGIVLQARGEYALSARDLSAAESELEFIDLKLDTPGKIGAYVYSGSVQEYRSPPIERMALNAFNMLNYLALGNLSGAAVEARRYQVMREYLETLEDDPPGRFGAYLAGFVFEKAGEPERALRYYREALADGPLASLDAPVARLESGGPAPTELLVVLSAGRTPVKVPERIPIGAAVGIAGTWITGDVRVLERSLLKVVVYPELVTPPSRVAGGAIRVDGGEHEPELLSDLAAEVAAEHERLEPLIVGAALTRLVARAAAAEGMRVAGRAAGGGAEWLGILAALGTEAALVGLDEPDTRSWSFLPGHVWVARVPVEPGEHEVEVRLEGDADAVHRVPVRLARGGWAAVVVTEPR